jgi:hypothetical protein
VRPWTPASSDDVDAVARRRRRPFAVRRTRQAAQMEARVPIPVVRIVLSPVILGLAQHGLNVQLDSNLVANHDAAGF